MIFDIFILIEILIVRRRTWDMTVITIVKTYSSLIFGILILFCLKYLLKCDLYRRYTSLQSTLRTR